MTRIIAAALALCIATPAMSAEEDCRTRTKMNAHLSSYGEAVILRGTSNDLLVEIWWNAETGTWSFTTTAGNGVSCLVGVGESMDIAADEVEGQL